MKITVEDISQAVCGYYNITKADITGERRKHSLSHPRQIAMFLCREYTTASMPFIGQKFGGRDHTTVLNSVRVVEARINSDEAIRNDVYSLRHRLDERQRLWSYEANYDRAWQTWAFIHRSQPTDTFRVEDGIVYRNEPCFIRKATKLRASGAEA